MTIRYPSGQQPPNAGRAGQPIVAPHSSSFAKRGMSLEKEINDANRYYLATEQAVIYKKPTPIQLVKVDYPKRSAAVVKEAYFKRPSTTDYNGVYQGYYVDFDAKETRGNFLFHSRTSTNTRLTTFGGAWPRGASVLPSSVLPPLT